MEEVIFEIVENKKIGKDVYLLVLEGSTKSICRAGEFVNVKVNGFYLRRPFSVCYYDENRLYLLYKILGKGTEELSQYSPKEKLNILVGLGNGFDVQTCKKPLLLAGGIGIAPMIGLVKQFQKLGIEPTLLYGAQSANDLVLKDWLINHLKVIFTTDDGSFGFYGNVLDYLYQNKIDYDVYYACGPQRMLQGLAQVSPNGYLSLEARMGCGFGACMGCSIQTTQGPKRVCKEGPVFRADEVIFE